MTLKETQSFISFMYKIKSSLYYFVLSFQKTIKVNKPSNHLLIILDESQEHPDTIISS